WPRATRRPPRAAPPAIRRASARRSLARSSRPPSLGGPGHPLTLDEGALERGLVGAALRLPHAAARLSLPLSCPDPQTATRTLPCPRPPPPRPASPSASCAT